MSTLSREEILAKVKAGAYLYGADLHGAYLRGAYLCGADLRGADLHGAYLYGAYLCGAYLYGADLHGADLRGADLHGAYLYGADLHGADLRGAKLADDITVKSVIARVTRMDGYEFFGWLSEKDELWIVAGCRGPWTVTRFREHVAKEYPDTPKAVETLEILNFIETRFSQLANEPVTPVIEPPANETRVTELTRELETANKTIDDMRALLRADG